jgi:pimeloyl-ACP methyl ester carboxylesterase
MSWAEDQVPTSDLQRDVLRTLTAGGNEASCAYNESISVVLAGPSFDRAALERALVRLVARHEALRCVFARDGATLRICPEVAFGATVEDLSHEGEPGQALTQRLRDDFAKPFELFEGPLFRFHVFSLGPMEHVVAITAHLAICDMWSLDVLVRDLGRLYDAESQGDVAGLPSAPSYRAYAIEEASFARTAAYENMGAYWRRRLERPIRPLDLPLRRERSRTRSFAGARHDVAVDPAVVKSLTRLAAAAGCSLYTVMLAGLALCLGERGGRSRVMVGMPVAGQAIASRKDLVGNCLRYVPLVLDADRNRSVAAVLAGARSELVSALENARFAVGDLADLQPAPTDPTRVPFLATCLNMSPKMDEGDLGYTGLDVRYEVNPRYFESFEFFINVVTGKNDHAALEMQYSAGLFEPDEVRRIGDALVQTYAALASDRVSPAPEKAPQPERSPPGEHAFFFDHGARLYGVHHGPKRVSRDLAVLVCYPIGEEVMRTFGAVRMLANQLLLAGVPVQRFDYYGQGDSGGGNADWSIETWVDNVVAAAEDLRRRAGVSQISIVGIRLGAAIASLAIERGLPVRDAVLWDPVVSGEEYLRSLERMHARILDKNAQHFPYPTPQDLDVDPDELCGFRFLRSFRRELGRVALTGSSFVKCRRVGICVANDRPDYRVLEASLRSAGCRVDYRVAGDDVGDWVDADHFEMARLPSATLENIVAFVKETS